MCCRHSTEETGLVGRQTKNSSHDMTVAVQVSSHRVVVDDEAIREFPNHATFREKSVITGIVGEA